jgi:hypothetical protein
MVEEKEKEKHEKIKGDKILFFVSLILIFIIKFIIKIKSLYILCIVK